MQALLIQDLKGFMAALLTKDLFYDFELVEAEVVTFARFHVDGVYHKDFLDDPSCENCVHTPWKLIQPYLFSCIRGTHTPSKIHLVLKLSKMPLQAFLASTTFAPSDLGGLYANINFEKGSAILTGGLSLTAFSMDRSLNALWDDYLKQLLYKAQIACTVR